jgi:molecular chaperone Hsp33
MDYRDYLQRLLFEDVAARAVVIRLDTVLDEVGRRCTDAPPVAQRLLAEALLLSGLMSSGLKFSGRISLQIRSDSGPLRMLVADCTDDGGLRGTVSVHESEEVPDQVPDLIRTLDRRAVLTLTLDPSENGQRWQGIVPFEGQCLADALAGYFERSEQLPTVFRLTTDGDIAAAIMLQRMPGDGQDSDGWRHLEQLLATIQDTELLQLPAETLLRRLFHAQRRRLFPARELRFHCPCNRERVENMLLSMGLEELSSMAGGPDSVEVRCQFCNESYRFEPRELAALYPDEVVQGSPTLH